MNDFVYDVETYPNFFLAVFQSVETKHRWIFEISSRINQSAELVQFLYNLRAVPNVRMVGFNNVNFDYLIIHYFLELWNQGYCVDGLQVARMIKARQIALFARRDDDKFAFSVWESDRFIPQVDLYMIHHFDNRNKSTSLKAIEINMFSHSVIDLPFNPDVDLTPEQMDVVTVYCCHDVNETDKFRARSIDMINQRAELNARTPEIDFTNFNDTKVGKQFFIAELERRVPGICYERVNGRKTPRMTKRTSIALADVILPAIQFQTPEFQRGLAFLKSTTITETKSPPELKNFNVTLRGFRFDIGAGGIHGSGKKFIARADDDNEIIDVDVASYYPNIAIKNRLYPEHLSAIFCEIYEDVYNRRKKLDKKSSESAMLKLALNGVYGESNSTFDSPFVDPKYTMAITFNGQLFLCMFAEALLQHPGITILQVNTDGVTAKVHRDAKAWFQTCFDAWQTYTRLELEAVYYRAMYIRDVNNYFAVTVDGKVKRKGAYQHDTSMPNNPAVSKQWHQDWSALVVPKAVEAHLIDGVPLADFIYSHTNPFDFMLRSKAPRGSSLMLSDGTQLQSIVRYHAAKNGPQLFKIMPALKGKTEPRKMAIQKGWGVNICNSVDQWRSDLLDYDFYIERATKLIGLEELEE